MKLFKLTKKFRDEEDGAVTVDWVVLTAAIVGLAVAIVALVEGGVTNLATDIASGLSAITVQTT